MCPEISRDSSSAGVCRWGQCQEGRPPLRGISYDALITKGLLAEICMDRRVI